MSPDSFAFSNGTRGAFRDHRSYFFDPVIDQFSQTNLGIRSKDSQSKVFVEKLNNEDLKVSFVYVLDNDQNGENGRLFMRDEFTLKGRNLSFKDYDRKFKYNYKGEDHRAWDKLVKIYQKVTEPTRSQAKKFFADAAKQQPLHHGKKLLGESLSSKSGLFSAIGNVNGAPRAFIRNTGVILQSVAPNFKFLFKDPESRLKVRKRKKDVVIIFTVVADDDKDGRSGRSGRSGRLVLREGFAVDKQSQRLLIYKRDWDVAPGTQAQKKKADALNKKPLPSKSEAEAFLKPLLPFILPRSSMGPFTFPGSPMVPGPIAKPKPFRPHVSGSKQETIFTFKPKPAGSRRDSQKTLGRRVRALARPIYDRKVRLIPTLNFSCEMRVQFDPGTGNVSKVTFSKVKTSGGSFSRQRTHGFLDSIASSLYSGLSMEKHPDGGYTYIIPLRFMPG